MQLEWEIADRSAQHQEETRRDIEERLLKIRTDYLHQSNDMQRDIELNALQAGRCASMSEIAASAEEADKVVRL